MALTPFSVAPGEQQGRIKPSGWVAPSGEYVLALGADKPGYFAILNAGDRVAWSQDNVGLNAPSVLRMRCHTRAASAPLPVGTEWIVTFIFDGNELLRFPVDRTRNIDDVVLNIGQWGTTNTTLEIGLTLSGSGTWLEVELPAFYLDAIIADVAPPEPMYLANRFPGPGEASVLASSTIKFDVASPLNIDGIDLARTKVWVNDQLAFDQGVFVAPFNGPGSSVDGSIDNSTGARFSIVPMNPFASMSTVKVRVMSFDNTNPSDVLDESYVFTIEDLTAPTIVAAMAVETTRVRVSFSEPVKMTNPDALDDTLNPANYIITRKSTPAVDVIVLAIEAFSASAVELITDIDLSPGATYELAVSSIEDLVGNPIITPSTVLFTAFVPSRPALRSFDLWRMIPQIARERDQTEDLRKFISCLQEVTDLLLYDIDRFTQIFDPDIAPEWALDLMLEGLGNPFPFTLSEIDKRRLLRVLVKMYRLKGTAVGIIDVVRFFLGIDITITTYSGEALVLGESELGIDWILGPSDAWSIYAFEIVAPFALTDEQRKRIVFIAEFMKPAHTHLARIVEPEVPDVIDHLELGLSELGVTWDLH